MWLERVDIVKLINYDDIFITNSIEEEKKKKKKNERTMNKYLNAGVLFTHTQNIYYYVYFENSH